MTAKEKNAFSALRFREGRNVTQEPAPGGGPAPGGARGGIAFHWGLCYCMSIRGTDSALLRHKDRDHLVTIHC